MTPNAFYVPLAALGMVLLTFLVGARMHQHRHGATLNALRCKPMQQRCVRLLPVRQRDAVEQRGQPDSTKYQPAAVAR